MKRPRSLTHSLEEWLEARLLGQDAEALAPIPATRALGEQFGISHGTVFRLLQRLEASGKVWRHPNGRFYPALAGRILGQAKPLAMMLRRMHAWSALCREVLEGFSEECAERDRPILWLHNRNLVEQKRPDGGLRLASPRAQRDMLRDFSLFHGNAIGGVLLDEIWRDEAIRDLLPAPWPVVSFFRPGTLPGTGSVAADFKAGALLAMSHLLASGYERIILINPLPDYEPARLFVEKGREVYREIAARDLPVSQIAELHSDAQRRDLFRSLTKCKARIGLICPEDNLSLSLAGELQARGEPTGRRIGLVSVMGTSQIKPGELTCVRYDFRQMGHAAATMLCENQVEHRLFAPTLDLGASTAR